VIAVDAEGEGGEEDREETEGVAEGSPRTADERGHSVPVTSRAPQSLGVVRVAPGKILGLGVV